MKTKEEREVEIWEECQKRRSLAYKEYERKLKEIEEDEN